MTRQTSEAWIQWRLGDLAPLSYGENLPEAKRAPDGRIPVFGSNGIVGHHDQGLIPGPAIIVGRKGTVGAVHFSPAPCWPIDTTFYILPAADRTDPRFLFHLLRWLDLSRLNAESAVPGLNRDAYESTTVVIPPLAEQIRIATALDSIARAVEIERQHADKLAMIGAGLADDLLSGSRRFPLGR